jgi:hypothetical protein
MAMGMGTIIIKRVRAMATAALAAVVVANMTRCVDSNGTEGTSAGRFHCVAHSMADLFTLALAVAAQQFSSTDTNQSTLGKVALVVVVLTVIVAGLFANIDHAVVAAVVVAVAIAMMTATSLGNGIAGAQFTARATILVLANSAVVMIVVRVFLGIRATNHIILGLTRTGVGIPSCIHDGY